MAGALIGALRVTLGLDASQFEDGTKGATRAARKLEKDLKATGQGLSSAGQTLTVGLTVPLAILAKQSVDAAIESRDALSQVENTLKTMGNQAGYTAEQLKALASDQMRNSLYDDDEILRKITNTMLTFGKVSGDTFARAQQAALDLSAKFGKDLQGSAVMVGKALQDPIKGVTALTKVGISFSAQQKAQIKDMVEAGRVADAQRLILGELERQVAGSAKAAAEANPFTALKHAWADFQESVGEQLLQVLPNITGALTTLVSAFASLSPEMQKWVVIGGIAAAALGPILVALGSLISIIATAAPALVAFGASVTAAATAAGVGGTIMGSLGAALGIVLSALLPVAAAAGAVYLAWKNWDTIGPMLDGLWKTIQQALGPPLQALLSAVSSAFTKLWEGPLGSLLRGAGAVLAEFGSYLLKAFGQEVINMVTSFARILGDVITTIAGTLNLIIGLLSGDWSQAWEGAKGIVSGVVNAIINVLDLLFPGARAAILRMVEGVKQWLLGPFANAFDAAKRKVRELVDSFAVMYDKVVGNSYVPDMVDGIAAQMSRLDSVMVAKGAKAAKAVTDSMRKMAQDVNALLANLFPEAAAANDNAKSRALIDQAEKAGADRGGLTAEQAAAARRRLDEQYSEELDRQQSEKDKQLVALMGGDEPLVDNEKIKRELDVYLDNLGNAQEETEDKTAKMIVSFTEMARDVVGSLRSMVQSFKSGDILGGIMGVLDLISQVTGIVSGIKGNTGSVRAATPGYGPGFSTGGSFKVGGSGGVDSKLVQFRATPGEMVDIRRPGAMNDNQGALVVWVKKGEMFEAEVERVASPLVRNASIQSSLVGSALAQRDLAKQRRNTLG